MLRPICEIAHFTKWASVLPISWNGHCHCPFRELGNIVADFANCATPCMKLLRSNVYVTMTVQREVDEGEYSALYLENSGPVGNTCDLLPMHDSEYTQPAGPLGKGVKYHVQCFFNFLFFCDFLRSSGEHIFGSIATVLRRTTCSGGDWFPRGVSTSTAKNFPS